MKHEHTREFRLLVAEIADVEGLSLPAALARARALCRARTGAPQP